MSSTSKSSSAINKNAQIAVIGAGASGLFTATILRQQGYKNITLFEKNSSVGGYAKSLKMDGHVFDYSIKIIPACTAYEPNIYAPLQEMLDKYNLSKQLLPFPNTSFFDIETRKLLPGPMFLKDYPSKQVVEELLTGWNILQKIRNYAGIAGVIEAGVALPGETFAEWVNRNQLPVFGVLCELVLDSYLFGPVCEHLAGLTLKCAAFYLVVFIKRILLAMGTDVTAIPSVNDNIKTIMQDVNPTASYVHKHGYLDFFEKLVEHEALDVRLAQGIRTLRTLKDLDGTQIELVTDNGNIHKFDALVIACSPHDALKFLDTKEHIVPLYQQVRPGSVSQVWSFRALNWPEALPIGRLVLAYPICASLGIPTTSQQCHAVIREYEDSNICLAVCYAKSDSSPLEAEQTMRESMQALGIDVGQVLDSPRFQWPPMVPKDAVENWYSQVETLQGQDNIFYVGEVFSSGGVVPVLDYLLQKIPSYFP
ncbi:NAD(P)-binding protein [Nostoc sp. C117]|uniref:NAD(P)-binding protein n=1 Tax=Nostoc sp. C117 TaxID=3349875 RepID=UPI00370D14A0